MYHFLTEALATTYNKRLHYIVLKQHIVEKQVVYQPTATKTEQNRKV
jgi:hypothetical protein